MKITYVLNKEHNGIEVKFDEKPERAVLDELKAKGFRWHGGKGIWFTKQSDEVIAYVKKLANEDIKVAEKSEPKEASKTELKVSERKEVKKVADKHKNASSKSADKQKAFEEYKKAKAEKAKAEPKAEPKKDNIVIFRRQGPKLR